MIKKLVDKFFREKKPTFNSYLKRDPHSFLLVLMQHKAAKLPEVYRSFYYTDCDRDDIQRWAPHQAQEISHTILRTLAVRRVLRAGYSCPFCLFQKQFNRDRGGSGPTADCSGCTYGERHGLCEVLESTYSTLREILSPTDLDPFTLTQEDMGAIKNKFIKEVQGD